METLENFHQHNNTGTTVSIYRVGVLKRQVEGLEVIYVLVIETFGSLYSKMMLSEDLQNQSSHSRFILFTTTYSVKSGFSSAQLLFFLIHLDVVVSNISLYKEKMNSL